MKKENVLYTTDNQFAIKKHSSTEIAVYSLKEEY